MGSNTSAVRDRKGKKRTNPAPFLLKRADNWWDIWQKDTWIHSLVNSISILSSPEPGALCWQQHFCDYQDEGRVPVASPLSDSDVYNLSGSPLYEYKCLTLPIPPETYRVTAAGSFHLAEAWQVGLEDVHLLHQGGESRLRGLADLLINSFRLRGER